MKRGVLTLFLLVFPFVLLAEPSQRYLVMTRHPFATAVHALPREDFDPAPRAALRIREFRSVRAFAADLTADEVHRLSRSSEVQVIEPVVERHALDDTITPGAQTVPYGVSMVHAPDVWNVTRGRTLNGTGPIHVAVIDTGVDYNAPELRDIFKGGHNFITGTEDPLDDEGHGSHVSGIIAAADDGDGVVGVAPAIDLYAVKVLDACGNGSSESVIQALDWVIQEKNQIGGNWVLNLSLGSPDSSSVERSAFQHASDEGLLVFAAAGNSYDETAPTSDLSFPAGYPSVVSVGAIDADQQVASFSQRGPGLNVVAPGVRVLSTFIAADVATNDGRTFAATTPVIVKDDAGTPLSGFCLDAPNVTAPFVFCNFGGSAADFPANVNGKIALIQRGPVANGVKFVDKILNAKNAGAVGVIIYDHTDEPLLTPALGNFTTPGAVPQFPPTIFISLADGTALQASPDMTVSLGFGFETWALESGTSMATPHAAAVGALAWAVAPTATNNDVVNAIENTARDLGDPGFDTTYGHGLVDALEAAKQLNPAAFGSGGTPEPDVPTGRVTGRRGH